MGNILNNSIKESILVEYHIDMDILTRKYIELNLYFTIIYDYTLFEISIMLNNMRDLIEEL